MAYENHRVMLVDDNLALLESVELLLRMEGFDTLVATDGEEALNLLRSSDSLPDLIISDVMMPNLDGFRLFEYIRQHREYLDIPFVFLTARDQIEDLRRGYSLGADDYLVKPFDHERLLLVIRSKLKRRDEMRAHLDDQQRAIETVKKDLAMMVAHELRTPLSSISMVSDLLSTDLELLPAEQVNVLLDTMQSGSIRLNRLIEQMVMYVQMQSGNLSDIARQGSFVFATHELLVSAVERARQMRPEAQNRPLHIDERDPDTSVSGDKHALRHALIELILNAFMFSGAETPVTILQWCEDDRVFITVQDTGPGIPKAVHEAVFQPFYQYNRAYYEQQGIGLGLALVKGIVTAHEGSVRLRSDVQQGVRVTIDLPLVVET